MGGPEAPAVVPAEVEKPKEEPKEPVLRQPEQNAEQNRQKREIESAERVEAEKKLAEQTADTEKAKQEEAIKTMKELTKKYPGPLEKLEKDIASSNYDPAKIETAQKALIETITDTTDKQKLIDAFKIVFPAKPEEKKEDTDKTSDALKGVGLGALLERLVDKLTKLFGKLTEELTKLFGSIEAKTKSIKSPLGGDEKITITHGYEKERGIIIAADAGKEIHSVTFGTVTSVKGKTVEITKDDGSKTIYTNIEPAAGLKEGSDATKIEPGKQMVIGKAASGAGIGFRYIDSNNTEQDPTDFFKKAELVEKEPETAPSAGAPQAPTAPPAVAITPATSATVTKSKI